MRTLYTLTILTVMACSPSAAREPETSYENTALAIQRRITAECQGPVAKRAPCRETIEREENARQEKAYLRSISARSVR